MKLTLGNPFYSQCMSEILCCAIREAIRFYEENLARESKITCALEIPRKGAIQNTSQRLALGTYTLDRNSSDEFNGEKTVQ